MQSALLKQFTRLHCGARLNIIGHDEVSIIKMDCFSALRRSGEMRILLTLQNNLQKGFIVFIFLSALLLVSCLLYTSPSPRDRTRSRMPSSA